MKFSKSEIRQLILEIVDYLCLLFFSICVSVIQIKMLRRTITESEQFTGVLITVMVLMLHYVIKSFIRPRVERHGCLTEPMQKSKKIMRVFDWLMIILYISMLIIIMVRLIAQCPITTTI